MFVRSENAALKSAGQSGVRRGAQRVLARPEKYGNFSTAVYEHYARIRWRFYFNARSTARRCALSHACTLTHTRRSSTDRDRETKKEEKTWGGGGGGGEGGVERKGSRRRTLAADGRTAAGLRALKSPSSSRYRRRYRLGAYLYAFYFARREVRRRRFARYFNAHLRIPCVTASKRATRY